MRVLKNYAVFSGRASRAEFWWFVLAYMITSAILGFILGFIGGITGTTNLMVIGVYLYYLAMTLPYIGVGIRRMHDTGHKGWWILVPLYCFYLWALPGESGENKYGTEPESDIM